MKQIEIKTLVKECKYDELSETDRRLVDAAKDATVRAYAPYSKYQVGAAILLDNGKIVEGSNQENAAYPSGTCAERTAAFFAASSNPGMAFKKIAVAAWMDPGKDKNPEEGFQDNPASPCGGCRQALMEYENLYGDIEVILYGKDKIFVLPSVKALLPLAFTDF
ncbi:MAG: cytidine deaminase [Muribaculaceae bacterium]|nr:cytidine deaminase [Muribaculaceae bacterium]